MFTLKNIYVSFRPVKQICTIKYLVFLVLFFFLFPLNNSLFAENKTLSIGDVRIVKSVKSMREMQTENIVMQKLDYSCGAASLATLMRYYFDEDITESDLLETARTVIEVEESQLKEKGLSLLDLKKIAEHHGFRAQGFKLTPDQLKLLKGPVLVFYKPFGYEHFAVLKGVKGNRVFIADPSRGHYRDALYRFAREWEGVVLALDKGSSLYEDSPLSMNTILHARPESVSVHRMMQAADLAY